MRRIGIGVLVAFGLTVLTLALPVAGVGAARTSPKSKASLAKNKLLSEGLKYYSGKTVTFDSIGAAGGTLDLWSRAMAPYLGTYLHASVYVQDLASGGGIQEQDAVASSAKNGLTIGWIVANDDVEEAVTNTPGINFNPERLSFIGASGPNISAFFAISSSPYTTWKAIQDSSTAVPIISLAAGGSDFWDLVVTGILGTKQQLVTGYSNNAAATEGFIRGDASVIEFPVGDGIPLVQSGEAKAVMTVSAIPKGSPVAGEFAGVPTFAKLLKEYPPKTRAAKKAEPAALELAGPLSGPILAGPTGTPAKDLTALRAAMKWASDQPGLKSELLKEGLSPGFIPGSEVKADYVHVVQLGSTLLPYLQGS